MMNRLLKIFLIIGMATVPTNCHGVRRDIYKKLPESVKQILTIREKGVKRWWKRSKGEEKLALISDGASAVLGFGGNFLCKNNNNARTTTNLVLGAVLCASHVLMRSYISEQTSGKVNRIKKKFARAGGMKTEYSLKENIPKSLAIFTIFGSLGWGSRLAAAFLSKFPLCVLGVILKKITRKK